MQDITKQEWVKIWVCVLIPFIFGISLAFFMVSIIFGSSYYDLREVESFDGIFFIFMPLVAYYYLIEMPVNWYQSFYRDSFPNFYNNDHGPSVAVRIFLSLFIGILIACLYTLLELPLWLDFPVGALVLFLAYYNMFFKKKY